MKQLLIALLSTSLINASFSQQKCVISGTLKSKKTGETIIGEALKLSTQLLALRQVLCHTNLFYFVVS